MQHVTRDDMIDPYIAAQVTAFDQALTEHLDDTNIRIDDFDGVGVEDEASDTPQWDTWDPEYGDEENTPNETEYGKMMEEPHPDAGDIVRFDKYIGVAVKMNNETNRGCNISTLKWRATDTHRFSIGQAHNNPLRDTREYEVELEDGTTDRYFSNVISDNVYY